MVPLPEVVNALAIHYNTFLQPLLDSEIDVDPLPIPIPMGILGDLIEHLSGDRNDIGVSGLRQPVPVLYEQLGITHEPCKTQWPLLNPTARLLWSQVVGNASLARGFFSDKETKYASRLVFDRVGLGKTLQTISCVAYLRHLRLALEQGTPLPPLIGGYFTS